MLKSPMSNVLGELGLKWIYHHWLCAI